MRNVHFEFRARHTLIFLVLSLFTWTIGPAALGADYKAHDTTVHAGRLLQNLAHPESTLNLEKLAQRSKPAARPNGPRAGAARKKKAAPPDLVRTPLEPADIAELPGEFERVDVFLLVGQSNMKGRGVMPEKPLHDPQFIMMHKGTDGWFLARHPLHLTGDPVDFSGADNAGVGPGLAFAQAIAKKEPKTRIALIPCAVGGTSLAKWQKGERLYEETIRRAKLALEQGPKGKIRIAGAIWLQGEADSSTPERIAAYPAKLAKLISDLRADLGIPDLPFIACTIGEFKPESADARAAINRALLNLPNEVPHTACVDGRPFANHIGDSVHFDTATQEKHGRLYADAYLKLRKEIDGK